MCTSNHHKNSPVLSSSKINENCPVTMQSQIIKSCLEKSGAAWIWDDMISINVSAVFISGEGVISALTITVHWWALTEGIPELASMITKTVHVTWVDVGLGGKKWQNTSTFIIPAKIWGTVGILTYILGRFKKQLHGRTLNKCRIAERFHDENNRHAYFEILPFLIFCTCFKTPPFLYIAHFHCIWCKNVRFHNPVITLSRTLSFPWKKEKSLFKHSACM